MMKRNGKYSIVLVYMKIYQQR